MEKTKKLIYYLTDWVFKDLTKIKEFDNVVELHYFLSGYQMSESNNLLKNGDGYWISDFMIYCDSYLHEKLKSKLGYNSGFIYYKKIQLIQKDDKDGLVMFNTIFNLFLASIDHKK